MKKFFTTLFSLALICSIAVLSSCSSAPSNEEVEKIIYKTAASMDQDDFSMLIDYVGAAIDESLPVIKKFSEARDAGDYDKLEDLMKERKQLQEKYPYLDEAMRKVNTAVRSDMVDESNMKKIEKISEKVMEAGVRFSDF